MYSTLSTVHNIHFFKGRSRRKLVVLCCSVSSITQAQQCMGSDCYTETNFPRAGHRIHGRANVYPLVYVFITADLSLVSPSFHRNIFVNLHTSSPLDSSFYVTGNPNNRFGSVVGSQVNARENTISPNILRSFAKLEISRNKGNFVQCKNHICAPLKYIPVLILNLITILRKQ